MRRRFNQSLLVNSWRPRVQQDEFCPESFSLWLCRTMTKYEVNTVMLEDWGINSQTLARWRTGKLKRVPKLATLKKICKGIESLSKFNVRESDLLLDADENMKSVNNY